MSWTNKESKIDYTGASAQKYTDAYTNRPEDAGSLKGIQGLLDKIGMVPGIGEPADLLNALLYGMQGEGKQAGLSALSMLPFLGGIIKPMKKAKKYYGLEDIGHIDPKLQEQKLFKDKARKKYFAEKSAENKRLEDDYFEKELNFQDIETDDIKSANFAESQSFLDSLFDSFKGKEF
jgi:hypothetical protein